jgi:hypothetical protein
VRQPCHGPQLLSIGFTGGDRHQHRPSHAQLGLDGLELERHELRHVELAAQDALDVGQARAELAQGADQLEPRQRPLVVDAVAGLRSLGGGTRPRSE